MSEGLEALENLKHTQIENPKGCLILWDIAEEKINTIEKELEALEIIQKRRVDISWFYYSDDVDSYNSIMEDSRMYLNQEEYAAVRDVLSYHFE